MNSPRSGIREQQRAISDPNRVVQALVAGLDPFDWGTGRDHVWDRHCDADGS
jgi:hypothetical protein